MSGHSKWSTIKRKKAATDAKRSKVFTRYLKEIQIAAKQGGSSPEGNPRLRTAIQTAKSLSIPADNIERAIKRGSGEMEGVQYEEITYEGYGPGGVAIMVKTLTDNKNRTAAEVRFIFSKCNGNLGSANSVAYIFSERGVITIPKIAVGEDELYEKALEAGATDISDDGDVWEVTTDPKDYARVREVIAGLAEGIEGEIRLIPSTSSKVTGKDAENVIKLLELLDDHDDVQSVASNMEIDEEDMAALAG